MDPPMSAARAATPDNVAITEFESSPVKSSKNVAGHDRDEVARKVFPRLTQTVGVSKFFKLLNEEQKMEDEALPGDLQSNEDLIAYLNKLSEAVRKEQKVKETIIFRLSEKKTPEEHPTGTKCRPDFVAIRIGPGVTLPPSVAIEQEVTGDLKSKQDNQLTWSQLETTGEIYSKGSTYDDSVAQGASYIGYLLQARPDLVSVVGMYVHLIQSHFRLYFTDAWGVCKTEAIKFNSTHTAPLFSAYIRRLYSPELRLNIRRARSFPSKPTFTIDIEDHGRFTGCVLIRVGSPFHRRSTIFTASRPSSPPTTESTPLIIKSQYVEKDRRFGEGSILRKIHKSYDFPGVVRLVPVTGAEQGQAIVEAESEAFASSSHESVANPDGEGIVSQVRDECSEVVTARRSVAKEGISDASEGEDAPELNNAMPTTDVDADWPHNRREIKKTGETLLLLQDKAGLLVDAKTPLEALIAFYDLLEVTRFLYKHRSIFHRDISAGNVLLREMDWKPTTPFEDDKFGDMCFASHLLGTNESRLHTRVVLIDFDMAEDREALSGGHATDRSGTPMFMARLVRNPVIKHGSYLHPQMPQLQGVALGRYETCVGNRLSEFRENDESLYAIKNDENIKYSHRLSYDAESTLWLLFSWAIQIKPVNGDSENRIDGSVWAGLTGGEGANDPRYTLLTWSPPTLCHPVYQGLDELLRSLLAQLNGYQELGARPPNEQDRSKIKDEYLHEAFQRTIFDFIVKMEKERFMKKLISPIRRRKEDGGDMSQSIRTPSIGEKRDRRTMEGTDVQSGDQRAATRPKPPTENPNFRHEVDSTSHPV